jgi:hypothetical protein
MFYHTTYALKHEGPTGLRDILDGFALQIGHVSQDGEHDEACEKRRPGIHTGKQARISENKIKQLIFEDSKSRPGPILPLCKCFFYSTSFYLLYFTRETAVNFYLLKTKQF